MKCFRIDKAIEILERTPAVLDSLLRDIDQVWSKQNEGDKIWSPFDVVGHLVHGEKTDWTDRIKLILRDSDDNTFQPFDRFAQFEDSKGKSMNQLLDEFSELRSKNMEFLKGLNLSENELQLQGIHPHFGSVKLYELLTNWVTHDLGNIAQSTRTMAKQYKSDVGPWVEYIRILKD